MLLFIIKAIKLTSFFFLENSKCDALIFCLNIFTMIINNYFSDRRKNDIEKCRHHISNKELNQCCHLDISYLLFGKY